MKQLISFILFFIAIQQMVFSQEETKWRVGISWTPENFTTTFGMNVETPTEDMHMKWEPINLNFSYGVYVERAITNKWAVRSGIAYASKDHIMSLQYASASEPFLDQEVNSKFVEIPVIGRYYFFGWDVGVHFEFGICNSFLHTNDLDGLNANSFQFGYLLGIGGCFDIGESLQMTFTPFYKRYITEFFQGNDYRFESVGVMVVMDVKF